MTEQPIVAEKVNGVEPVITVEKMTEADAVATHDEDVPTFDFGELSYGDIRQLQKTHAKALRLKEKGDDPTLTEEQADALEAQAEAMMDQLYDSVALTITYMPKHWLVTRAPSDVDIRPAGELRKYLRGNRIMDLLEEFKRSQEKKA